MGDFHIKLARGSSEIFEKHLEVPGRISFYGRCSGTPIGKNADLPPHTHAVGGQPPCCPQQTATICVLWSWCLKGCFASAPAVEGMRT